MQTSFSNVLAQGPILIEFYRLQCPACKLMAPVVKDVAGKNGVKLLMADAAQNIELGQKLKIESVPTLVMFAEGKEKGRLVGRQPANIVEDCIKQWQIGG